MTLQTFAARIYAPIAVSAALLLTSAPGSAAVMTFTDQLAFEAEFGAQIIVEEFDGAASGFAADSTGNAVGSGISVDVNGPAGSSTDTGPTGLTGQGQLQAEVDSVGGVLTIDLNFAGPVLGFGFVIQNDSQTNAASLDLEEIGVRVAGQSFILSDILGLSTSSDGAVVGDVESSGPQFFGFASDIAFSSLTFVHGDDVASGSVNGDAEEFFLNSATLAPEISVVPLPAGGLLLLTGFGGLAALNRCRRKTVS